MRRPSPNHREADTLEGFCQVQNQRHRYCKTFPFPSIFPTPFVEQLRFDHPWRPNQLDTSAATSGALKATRLRINVGKSAIGLSLVTLFGIRKNIVVQNSKIFPLVSFVKFKGTCGWNPSHPTPVLPCTISTLSPCHLFFFFNSAALPRISSVPHSSKVCPSRSALPHCAASVLPILSSMLHSGFNNLASSSSFFRICVPPLHAASRRNPTLPSALLIS